MRNMFVPCSINLQIASYRRNYKQSRILIPSCWYAFQVSKLFLFCERFSPVSCLSDSSKTYDHRLLELSSVNLASSTLADNDGHHHQR